MSFWKRATRSVAPGICFAIPAFARTPTCTRSAIRFDPWQTNSAIADGASIRSYIRDTAQTYGIDSKVYFAHRVKRASWSSATALWTLEAERGTESEPVSFTCNFLLGCTGYYD